MLNVAVLETTAPTRPTNGLEAWFMAMGQTDYARMDEDKPLVHEVKQVIASEYRITMKGLYALREDEQMRQAIQPPVITVN